MNEVYRDIEKHIPGLRRYALALAHNSVAADDLVQESVLRALSRSHQFRPGTNLRAWLFTILHNQYISNWRQSDRMGPKVDPDDAATALATPATQEHRLAVDAVGRALDTLPDTQRILIELVALQGRSYDEISASFKLPPGTVKSRISRGRQALRRFLDGKSDNSAKTRANT